MKRVPLPDTTHLYATYGDAILRLEKLERLVGSPLLDSMSAQTQATAWIEVASLRSRVIDALGAIERAEASLGLDKKDLKSS